MKQILPALYLGNRDSAFDLAGLTAVGITHIVNCTIEVPNFHEGRFEYLHLKLYDPDPCFRDHLRRSCEFIDAGRREGGVLVHCFASISRSPSIVLGYLCHLGHQLEEAARQLGTIVWTDPDRLFLGQLVEHLGLVRSEEDLRALSCLLHGRPITD